jgi:hypothetical protein
VHALQVCVHEPIGLARLAQRQHVHRDHELGAERARSRYGNRIDERAVDEQAPVDAPGREDARDRDARAHGVEHGSARERDLVAAEQVGRDGCIGQGESFDLVAQVRAYEFEHAPAAQQSLARPGEIEQAQHAPARQPLHRRPEFGELARRVRGADERARARARHAVEGDPRLG